MNKILGLDELDHVHILEFARSLRACEYEIVKRPPGVNNVPKGLFSEFTDKDSYAYILEDNDASYGCFFLLFNSVGGESIGIPIGVFGSSPRHKINFPLLANDQLRGFLELSKSDLGQIMQVGDHQLDDMFSCVLDIRFHLLKIIFRYYGTAIEGYNSVMSWPARDERSLTRRAAESLRLCRIVSPNGKTEIYSFEHLDNDCLAYLRECSRRWKELGDGIERPQVKSQEAMHYEQNLFNSVKVLYGGLAAATKGEKIADQ